MPRETRNVSFPLADFSGAPEVLEPALANQLQLPQQLPGALPIRTRQRSGPCSR